ncbi:aspartyl protease family protein [Reichenbachiella carrageenanivorans]|uniref:Aspartyl protease family protein n=1 Tax=Reichenbachiella carrageenanivorans TaxID=2979869 RepID=A0ABY6D258_9BACT|nr:aspartyl protease family protein [Reichenbachiella carrageenanivorans]UXX80247.1 aspartyl protease family protein [Reichenbachiella carrageenanivorans]
MKQLRIYLLVASLFIVGQGMSQQIGFDFPSGTHKVTIPFERYNNLIVIPVTINHSLTLKFIFDTGVQYPILTEKMFGEYLNLDYSRNITIQGPGEADSIKAKVAHNVSLSLPGGVESGISQALVVLEEDYLKLRNNLGVDVFGVIGYDLFSRFVVEINYDENHITLYEPKKFRARNAYKKIPMKVVNTKPYVEITIMKNEKEGQRMHLMVDSGASHAVLLDNPEDNSLIPEQNITTVIGRGLGGNINGYLGRMASIRLGKFEFEEPIASFPIVGDYGEAIKRGSRNGTIGGELLSRFNVVFDYFGGYLYLKKGSMFNKEFEHDMSGMHIAADGKQLKQLKIYNVRADSPAYHAGLREGDLIESINGYSLESLEFSDFCSLLRNRPGKKIVVKYTRNGSTQKTTFKLERYI